MASIILVFMALLSAPASSQEGSAEALFKQAEVANQAGNLSGAIELYRKLAQAMEKPLLEALQKEMRDRFGPLPVAVELLLAVAELKILAGGKNVTSIEVEDNKLKLVRAGDFITLGGKFPRLTKKEPQARLKEIKRLLLAI